MFGISVATYGNGIVVAGAFYAAVNGHNSQGAAYVFTGSGLSWSEVAKLTASDGAADNYFGVSVATNGNTVVVGTDESNSIYGGAAYIFTEPASGWASMTQTAEITQGAIAAVDFNFGDSVAISGNTVVVGAPDDSALPGSSQRRGMFSRLPNPARGGTTWN